MHGSAYGEAFGDGAGRMRAEWYSTVLVGDIPGVGRAVMHYEEEPMSTVQIVAQAGANDDFFPADATQTLHYRITIVDDEGRARRELTADRPMVMTATIDAIPPVGARFNVAETITFSDVPSGDPVLVLRGGSQGVVLDAAPVPLAVDGIGALENGRIEFNVTAEQPPTIAGTGAPLWWSVTAHGIDLDEQPPLLAPIAPGDPLRISGARAVDGTGMVVVHAFNFGVDEESLHEGHIAQRV